MTNELTTYIQEIRSDLQSKIQMLAATPGMSLLQVRKAQNLAADCRRLDTVLSQFAAENAPQERRKRYA